MTPRRIQRFGWTPDRPDQRDLLYLPHGAVLAALPDLIDMRSGCPPIVDQGQLGSCTANAIGSAVQFEQMKQGLQSFQPSRLFIYYEERKMEGTISTDSGAMIRDGMTVVHRLGAPPETLWPYDISKFTRKPTQKAYRAALKDQVLQYQRITQNLDLMRACLADGYPFVFGFTVYDSFESQRVAQTGIVPMPQYNESVLGGHAVMAIGYDNQAQTFLCRNSWGSDWGMAGYFTMPFAYLTSPRLASDFWTTRLVEG
jgi:C1A family cysteine protease